MLKYYPLEAMRLRNDAGLQSQIGAIFGQNVRSENGNPKSHQGWDLYAQVGTPVFAIADGKILWTEDTVDYGKQMLLEFMLYEREGLCSPNDRRLYAFYAHLSEICLNGFVKGGQKIAETGVTGNADNKYPHLHFEVRTSANKLGQGLEGRLDPGEVLGYHFYSSGSEQIGGVDTVRMISVSTGKPTRMILR